MNDEFLDYYYRELKFIREMGAEFAGAHPQEAGQLLLDAQRCEDPHVERLLEGFAFLTARIRKKIDDEYPEITDALLSILYPHYQRPIPSITIVQFMSAADATKIAGGHEITRGTALTSRPVDGVPCRFRTVYPAWLWPVSVASASLVPDRVVIADKPNGAVALLKIELQCSAPGGWPALDRLSALQFYLNGGEPIPSTLYECLFNHLCGFWLRGKTADGREKTVPLPVSAIQPVGFSENESLLPYPPTSFPGYRLIQEFFAFPEKFLFIEISSLDKIRASGFEGPVELLMFLDQPPRTEVAIRADSFQLGCTPAVNLFEKLSEPIRISQKLTEYPVVPDVEHPLAYEIFSVDRVVSAGSYLDDVVEFEPFYAMRHAIRGSASGAFWFSHRRPSMRDHDDGTEIDLSFTDPNFNPLSPAVETASIHLTCTNRDLPARLPFGGEQADFEMEGDAPVRRVRVLSRPSRALRPPLGRSAQWRLISQLGLNHLSLTENGLGAESLRELLTLYDFAGSASTRKMISGLIGVDHKRVAGRTGNRLGNTLSLGIEITVRFDEDAFPGSSAFLMASVLERFLGAYVSINSFSQLVARSKQREGIWKQWPPRCGDRTLL